jgi:hypothetical protein
VCRLLKSPIRFSPEDNFSRSFPQAPDPHFRSFSTLPFPSTLQSPTGPSACVIHGPYTQYRVHNSHMHLSGTHELMVVRGVHSCNRPRSTE